MLPGGTQGPSRNEFLRLLVLQLQNQDPLNPISDQNFTAQLAQFSSLEQLGDVNANLRAIGAIQETLVNAQALNLLGKTALVAGLDRIQLHSGRADAMSVEVPAGAAKVDLVIKDSSGRVVRTLTVPAAAGRHQVAWDGTDGQGGVLADGEYTVEVDARDAEGKTLPAALFVALVIDGVGFTELGVRLSSGGREVSFDQILEIRAS